MKLSSSNSESQIHLDSPHSPETPPRTSPEIPLPQSPDNSKATVSVDKFTHCCGDVASHTIINKVKRKVKEKLIVKIATPMLRLFEVVFCLISFSLWVANKTHDRSGDSFHRYKEYKYFLYVNVIAFVYSVSEVLCEAVKLTPCASIICSFIDFRALYIFFMDQVLAYLLISASSSAATKVNDWQSNRSKDVRASASVAIAFAFLAFIAFAISSVISCSNAVASLGSYSKGYWSCTLRREVHYVLSFFIWLFSCAWM